MKLLANKKARRKVLIAGNYVRAIQYTTNTDPDVRKSRAPKSQISSVAQESLNLRHSWEKLKATIAANFGMGDLVVTLTYDDDHRPALRRDAENKFKLFIRKLRTARKADGLDLKYIYVTEQGHSSGKLHHHLICNNTGSDYATIRSLWKYGDNIDFRFIWHKGYDGWARYLSKEPRDIGRRYVGERMWRGSKGLAQPKIITGWVDASTMIDAPPGAYAIDKQERDNIYGKYTYVEFVLPAQKTEQSLALISDLG